MHSGKPEPPSPRRAPGSRHPTDRADARWLALANVVGFALCGLLATFALGGYALEHVPHNTALTDALQAGGVVAGLAAVGASLLSVFLDLRAFAVNVAVLAVWPAELLLTGLTWVLLF